MIFANVKNVAVRPSIHKHSLQAYKQVIPSVQTVWVAIQTINLVFTCSVMTARHTHTHTHNLKAAGAAH